MPKAQHTSIVRHWYWVALVSLFFVGVMVVFYFFRYPAWFHYAFRAVSLAHEMDWAVWWSGICLFMAGLVFTRVGTMVQDQGGKAWVWYVMALAMVALCVDEVGSIHENVARVGGWLGLLPFALIFAVAFGIAFLHLIQMRSTRIVAAMIFAGIGIFVVVAGLEFLEHDLNFTHPFWRRVRQVGEEGIELLAMGILIAAGLVAMRRMGDPDRRFLNAMASTERISDYQVAMFILFVFQVVATAALIAPNYSFFPEGNPSALFPMLLFFCLGIMARLRAQGESEYRGYWQLTAVVLFITSILQLYNFNIFLNNIFGVNAPLMTGPPSSWLITLTPYLMLAYISRRSGTVPTRQIRMHLLLLGCLLLLLYPDLELRHRIEYLYFMFSASIDWSCYLLIRETKVQGA